MKNLGFCRWPSLYVCLMLFFGGLLRGQSAGQSSFVKPEKNQLEVAIAAWGGTAIPTAVAWDGGYFAKHGLAVSIAVVSASTSVQGSDFGEDRYLSRRRHSDRRQSWRG